MAESHPSSRPPSETARGTKEALYAAVGEVVRTQAAARAAEQAELAKRRARSRVSPTLAACVTILLAVAAYAVIERPTWLVPPAPPVESRELQEASLRLTIGTAVQRVERFRRVNGRLPASLEETGPAIGGITYRRLSGDAYAVAGVHGRVRLTYRSGESLAAFVGDSYTLIARRASR